MLVGKAAALVAARRQVVHVLGILEPG